MPSTSAECTGRGIRFQRGLRLERFRIWISLTARVFAPTGRPEIARGGSPWKRERVLKTSDPTGRRLQAPPRWGGGVLICRVAVQGLPPLAILGRPVGAED